MEHAQSTTVAGIAPRERSRDRKRGTPPQCRGTTTGSNLASVSCVTSLDSCPAVDAYDDNGGFTHPLIETDSGTT